jgi:nucleotidyltransferase/DNA polymerase involved in DNA repair
MKQRTIFHVDMDAFFASVEILKNPALKGKAVIIGGHPDQRGVVSTCSYEARKFGVHSAMSMSQAKRLCPHATFIQGSYSQYREYSEQVMAIFRTLTEKVEVVSIDEAYLDVTDVITQYPNALTLGEQLRQIVHYQTQLTCSVGIASNKLVAKIASSSCKPNGLFEIPMGEESNFLKPLPVKSLPGVGEKTYAFFYEKGIRTVADLQEIGLEELISLHGARGYHYHFASHGIDNRPVEWIPQPPKSIGAEHTFGIDQTDPVLIKEAMLSLIEKAWRYLIKHKMRTHSITLKLRDDTFKTITRAQLLFADTQDLKTLQREFIYLFDVSYQNMFPLRLIGISFRKLTDSCWQPTLWDWETTNPFHPQLPSKGLFCRAY